jgi:hypothetical protein
MIISLQASDVIPEMERMLSLVADIKTVVKQEHKLDEEIFCISRNTTLQKNTEINQNYNLY